jgi:dihydropteroate synthase
MREPDPPGDPAVWRAGRFRFELVRPLVMGIVNATPDSFFDQGRHAGADAARAHCDRLRAEGADILDIGGESTRPGAAAVDAAEEASRVVPVLRHALTLGSPVSVDTSEPRVIEQALELGVDIVNDVRALRRPGALAVLGSHGSAGVCLMHMRGEPPDMQKAPRYDDVVAEVGAFLSERMALAAGAGIERERIVLDPGFGFGKSLEHNLALARGLGALSLLGRPLLVGWSRKGSLARLTGRPDGDRLAASIAAAIGCVARGASIVRVHDVAATVDALKVWAALGPAPSLEGRGRSRAGDNAS